MADDGSAQGRHWLAERCRECGEHLLWAFDFYGWWPGACLRCGWKPALPEEVEELKEKAA